MPVRYRLLIGIVVAVGLCILIPTLVGREATLQNTIRSYGFRELVPPVSKLPPGTIVNIEAETSLSVTIGRVCVQASAVPQAAIVDAEAPSRDISQKLSRSWTLKGDYLSKISGEAAVKAIRNITLTLSDVHVPEISDEEVIRTLPARTTNCDDAIRLRRPNVAMLKRVLQADAKYTINYDTHVNLDASAKKELLKGLAAGIGGDVQAQGDDVLVGTSLVWGVVDDKEIVFDKPKAGVGNAIFLDPARKPEHLLPGKAVSVAR